MVHYDVVYMSKVFSSEYSPDVPEPLNADQVIKGGTGYAIDLVNGVEVYHKERDPVLLPEIENICPDYSIYPELAKDTAHGFLTRGCPRGCAFCHVAKKEGRKSCQVAELSEFWRGQRNIEIMDPNILACKDREKLLEQLAASRAYVDFNQGLDIRLADRDIADLIGRIRVQRLHFAWDNPKDDLRPYFQRFSEWYRRKDPSKKVVYVLTNFGSTLEEDTVLCVSRKGRHRHISNRQHPLYEAHHDNGRHHGDIVNQHEEQCRRAVNRSVFLSARRYGSAR